MIKFLFLSKMNVNQNLKTFKKYIWILLFSGVSISQAQKEDYNWVLGYADHLVTDTLFGRTILNFNNASLNITKTTIGVLSYLHYTNATISDSSGKLLFYTNGISAFNRNHQIMPNGKYICPGEVAEWNFDVGLAIEQAAIILPWPEHSAQYFIINKILQAQTIYLSDTLYYSTVNMKLRGGLGDVVDKHKILLADTMSLSYMTACRHANGRDWWFLIAEYDSKIVHRYLLDPRGINHIGTQIIDEKIFDTVGQAAFSPDGNKFAIHYITDFGYRELHLFDFDRCNGLLMNQRTFKLPYTTSAGTGLAFAPSSKYLYLTLGERVWQIDTDDNAPVQNKIEILVSDHFGWPYEFFYDQMQLAPDSKIYFVSTNGANYINVIHDPDKKGLACKPEAHAHMITFNLSNPNFPHFRLGRAWNTICDTLYTAIHEPEDDVKYEPIYVYPNPAHSQVNIFIPIHLLHQDISYRIFDLQGKLVDHNNLKPSRDISINNLSTGIYYIRVFCKKDLILNEKMVIINE
ncbi:MAG: T9SS type A sorting domain-containing protein [Saprospiraceae bacterium]|nr:T9SS type A sorting domain-containing protein [Candidatus Defluviibacterium haderslevense]